MKHTLKRFAALLLALVLLTGLLPSALADGAEPTNVALGKTVTDGGWGNPAGWPYWDVSFLTDGDNHDLSGGNDVGWSSADPIDQNQDVELTIDLAGSYDVSKISVYPTVFDAGKFFPGAYTVYISADGTQWEEVASDTFEDVPAVEAQEYTFETKTAAYVRVTITEHRFADNKYVSQLGQIEVYGVEIAAEASENVAIGQKVTADNYFEEPDSTQHYSVLWLVDGKYTDGSKYGYSTKKGITSATDSPANIIVELEGVYDVSRVTLVPVQVDGGIFFPEDYTIQLSEDGENWEELVSVTGAETGPQARNHDAAQPIQAKYVRLQLTRHRYATGSPTRQPTES